MRIVPSSAVTACVALVLGLSVSGACTGQGSDLTSPISPSAVFAGDSALTVKQSATGCPAWGNPGGNPGLKFIGVMSPEVAAERWSAQITDAWYAENGFVEEEFLAGRLAFATGVDKNGDGLLCVAQSWGQDLNPNSHWAQFWADTLNPPAAEAWFLSDNHVGTSDKG